MTTAMSMSPYLINSVSVNLTLDGIASAGTAFLLGLPIISALIETQNKFSIRKISCGKSRIILNLALLHGALEAGRTEHSTALKFVTNQLISLTAPWYLTGKIICRDRFFASVEAALEIYGRGLTSIVSAKIFYKEISYENFYPSCMWKDAGVVKLFSCYITLVAMRGSRRVRWLGFICQPKCFGESAAQNKGVGGLRNSRTSGFIFLDTSSGRKSLSPPHY